MTENEQKNTNLRDECNEKIPDAAERRERKREF